MISAPSKGRGGAYESFAAPPGGRLWHGFAVRRPPVERGGRSLTFGLIDGAGFARVGHPMQMPPALDMGGMERKPAPVAFFTERTLASFLALSDRTTRNWIRRSELPSYKLGASRRIDPADVEDFPNRHRDETA
jgi:excisionase family DNA binding protein